MKKMSLGIMGMMLMLALATTPALGLTDNGGPSLSIVGMSYDPYPAQAGDYFDLWIKVENTGSMDAEGVTCVLEPEYPFMLDPGRSPEKQIGEISPHEHVLLQYRLRVDDDSPDGWHDLWLKCKTSDSSSWVSQKIQVVVENLKPNLVFGSITTMPSKLLPDTTDNEVVVQINNIGDGDAKSVTARLLLPPGFEKTQSYSDISPVGLIPAGGTGTATFYVDVDENTTPGDYSAVLLLEYRSGDSDEYNTVNLSLPLSVKPTPLFEIESVEISPEVVGQGDSVTMKVRIKNTGTKKAESISMRVYKQEDQPFEFDEKYDYIGTLEPGEDGEAVFRFTVESDAPLKTYILDTEIRYLVDDQVRTVEERVPVRVEKEKKTDTRMLVAGVVLVFALVTVAYYYVRNAKGREKVQERRARR